MDKTNRTLKEIEALITTDSVLFFDMDGTIVDTDFANFLSYKKAIRSVTDTEQNLTYNPDKRFNRSNLKTAISNLSEADYDRIIQQKESFYNDFLNETTLNKDVVDILSKYSKTNKTILVTNCREERANMTLAQHGLIDMFTHKLFRKLISKDHHVNKFENALASLNLSVQSVVVFENEEFEIGEALKAGIPIENIISV